VNEPLFVFGGGRLGAALARVSRTPTRVFSPTPRPHAGLWLRWTATDRLPEVDGAHVCLALAPRGAADAGPLYREVVPDLVRDAWRLGAARVTVCGPAGRGDPVADAFAPQRIDARSAILRLGALFGVDDRCLWPLVVALREKGTARLPRGVPATRWLWLEDAARAALRVGPGVHTLLGHEAMDLDAIGDRLVARFGGACSRTLFGDAACAPALRSLAGEPDDWESLELGERLSVGVWVAKLPGLRRGR
jgi:hypothetical protein